MEPISRSNRNVNVKPLTILVKKSILHGLLGPESTSTVGFNTALKILMQMSPLLHRHYLRTVLNYHIQKLYLILMIIFPRNTLVATFIF